MRSTLSYAQRYAILGLMISSGDVVFQLVLLCAIDFIPHSWRTDTARRGPPRSAQDNQEMPKYVGRHCASSGVTGAIGGVERRGEVEKWRED